MFVDGTVCSRTTSSDRTENEKITTTIIFAPRQHLLTSTLTTDITRTAPMRRYLPLIGNVGQRKKKKERKKEEMKKERRRRKKEERRRKKKEERRKKKEERRR